MSILTVSSDGDYSAVDLSGTTEIVFTNTGFGNPATAIFLSSQVSFTGISPTLSVTGSIGPNHLVFNGGDIIALNWTFTKWNLGDSVTFNGGSAADQIVGMGNATGIAASLHGLGGNDTLQGNTGHDSIYGGAGNDLVLSGGGLIDGGAGIDRLSFLADWSTTAMNLDIGDGGGGRDIGVSSPTTVVRIEQLSVTGTGLNDTISGAAKADFVYGADGNDSLQGRGGDDTLFGDVGDDTISGGAGNDVIEGATGRDHLTGGGGADRFLFNPFSDGSKTVATADVITDFTEGSDKIDLLNYVLDGTNLDHSHAVFVGETAFFGFPGIGEVRFYLTATNTVVQIARDAGFGMRVMEDIVLTGQHHLTANDFIL